MKKEGKINEPKNPSEFIFAHSFKDHTNCQGFNGKSMAVLSRDLIRRSITGRGIG